MTDAAGLPGAAALTRVLEHLALGRVDDALRLAEGLVASHPDSATSWHALSEAAAASRRPLQATAAAEQAVRRDPGNLMFQAQLARCLQQQGLLREALTRADAISAAGPRSAMTLDLLGQVYAACDEHGKARQAFEAALARAPNHGHLLFNLATACRNSGDFATAEALYDRIILSRPRDYEAYKNRSDLRTQTPEHNHIAELTGALDTTGDDWRGEAMLAAALAKEHEDLGQYSQSFRYLRRCNDIRRSHLAYDVGADIDLMARVAEAQTAQALAAPGAGYESEEPIFILGLPRTGSTLLERMLGAHSQVFAAGELQNFPVRLAMAANTLSPDGAVPASPAERLARAALTVDARALGQDYVDSTRPRTGHTPRFIDKLPNNFLNIGAIHRALPKARMIRVTRAPMDACFAIYKTLFKDGYPYSYDFADLAAYFAAYGRLMDHFHVALPGRILTVAYEDLVRAPEETIRRVLSHCGLSYEPACLRFHESGSPTSTASAVQVRQPLYASSIGRWRAFEEELAPLGDLLRANAITW